MTAMQICVLSSEILPYAKTGGLADVVGALIPQLKNLGHDVRAFMPLYPVVRRKNLELAPVIGAQQVVLNIGGTDYTFSLLATRFPGSEAPVYLVDCPALLDRSALYTTDADEHRRFILFTRAVLDSCRRLGFSPHIFHCNDWHTALLPLYLRSLYAGDGVLSRSKSIMTIHNIGYQGIFGSAAVADLGLGMAWTQLDQQDLSAGIINPLKTGLKYADRVTTVSPTYAREICEAPLGMGMEAVLRSRSDRVIGILNGVDYDDWDPRHDRHLSVHFSAKDLGGKEINKRALLQACQLQRDPHKPLIGMVSRLAEQKGIDLLFDALPALLKQRDFGLVVLGSGETHYERFFRDLASNHGDRVSFRAGYDEAMAHLIEAGSDIFLMPSRYEPCGLNQMYSLRYGTVPVVRNTGGLADSVQHFDPESGSGTGCVFNDFDAPAVRWAVGTALDWFANPALWRRLMQNAMAKDFSWERQVQEYDRLYRNLAG
jgi:starch synthase